MVEIIPAILPKDFEELKNSLGRVVGLAPWVQIDVCDGVLVPSKTWPYKDPSFTDFVSQEEGLPHWQDFDFEIDMMVDKPLAVLEDWIAVGASRIIMQVGGRDSIEAVRAAVNGRAEFAVAVDVKDDLKEVEPYLVEGDTIQVMGISRVGFQHQPLDEKAVELLKYFRDRFPDAILSVDGGVNLDTAARLVEAGANRLAVGSALFGSPDIAETLEEFKKITRK